MSLDEKELFKEKDMWALLRLSWNIPFSSVNIVVTGVVLAALLCGAIFCAETEFLVSATRELAKYWLAIGLNTLGFLISGFAIFTALGRPKLFVMMAQVKHSEYSNFTWLKYTLLVFVEVLMFYVLFSAFCAFVVIFCDKGGLVSRLTPAGSPLRGVFGIAGFSAMGIGITWSILALMSYIYIIYSTVLVGVKWDADSEKAEKKSAPHV